MADEQKKSGKKFRLPRKWKSYLAKALIFAAAFLIAFWGNIFGTDVHRLSQTELLQKARQGRVAEVVYEDDTNLTVRLKDDPRQWEVTYPEAIATDTLKGLSDARVAIKPKEELGLWGPMFTLFMILVWVSFIINLAVPLVKKAVAKGKGQVVHGSRPGVKLDNVKGVPEVVAELKKIAVVLGDPGRYAKMGARPPAGLVLHGPPGTGKTLLAKALAGEAGVPFYEVTGSSVRSMWVGQAGRAIKAYFDKARQHPVSIIFFDEGDTIGGRRSERPGGGDQEHRAMVNELLAQMNPDKPGGTVFVIIATNDPDLLDEALTRSGRIDLKLAVLPPDMNGRKAILGVHTGKKPLGDDVDFDRLALETYGAVGADLEALANNAALEAATRGADEVSMADFDHALLVMRAGPARQDRVVTDQDKEIAAFHEAGHTLCAAVQELIPDPTSVTILSHGSSGGHTNAIPDEATASQYMSREAARQQLVMYMGGVAGEKLALDADYTNGASSDRRAATELAVNMVCYWGMGTYNSAFGRDWRTGPHADEVWGQVEALLDEAEMTAIKLLLKFKPTFDTLVEDLLEKETLRAGDLRNYHPAAVEQEELERLEQQFEKVLGSVEIRSAERGIPHNGFSAKPVSGMSA